MLSNANPKESKGAQRELKERTFGKKLQRRKVVTRVGAATQAAKKSKNVKVAHLILHFQQGAVLSIDKLQCGPRFIFHSTVSRQAQCMRKNLDPSVT